MANPSYERERIERTDVRIVTGDPGRADVDTNPDAHATDGRGERDRASITSLLKDLRDESTTLIRQELALAKVEMSEKASVAARNAAAVAVGGAVLYLGAIVLLLGVASGVYFLLVRAGLSHTLAGLIAFLVIGGGTGLVGYLMLQKGISTLKNLSPVPEKTVESLKEDKQWLTNEIKK